MSCLYFAPSEWKVLCIWTSLVFIYLSWWQPCLNSQTMNLVSKIRLTGLQFNALFCFDTWDVIINKSAPYNFFLIHWQHFAWSHILPPGLYQVHSQLHWSLSTYLSILKISKLLQNSHGSSTGHSQPISLSWKITFLMQAPPFRHLLN